MAGPLGDAAVVEAVAALVAAAEAIGFADALAVVFAGVPDFVVVVDTVDFEVAPAPGVVTAAPLPVGVVALPGMAAPDPASAVAPAEAAGAAAVVSPEAAVLSAAAPPSVAGAPSVVVVESLPAERAHCWPSVAEWWWRTVVPQAVRASALIAAIATIERTLVCRRTEVIQKSPHLLRQDDRSIARVRKLATWVTLVNNFL